MHATAECMHGVYLYGGIAAALALLTSFVVLWYLVKSRFFASKNGFVSLIFRTYFVAIPLAFTVFGFVFTGLITAKNYTISQQETNVTPMIKLIFPSYQYFLVVNWQKIIAQEITFGETVTEFSQKAYIEAQNNNFEEEVNVYLSNLFLPKMVNFGIQSIIYNTKTHSKKSNKTNPLIIARTANTFAYSKTFWGDVNTTMQEKISNYFNRYLVLISMSFILFLSLLLFSFLMSNKLRRS